MTVFNPPSSLPLRDQLALERTHLANERTGLAYLRTGLALFIAGLSLINFFRDNVYVWLGVLCLPLGLGVVGVGWMRYRTKRRHIAAAQRQHQPA